MSVKMQILIFGMQRKLARGENLEDVLSGYVYLTEEEKGEIRAYLK